MATVSVDLGSVIGPTGATGPAGTYTLTSADKEDIAEIVGDDKYLPKTALNIDAYKAESSSYPTVVDYVIGTVTVTDSDGNTIATLSTNQQRVTMYCPPYSRYIVSVTANGYDTPTSQTIVVQPNGSTISFSMNKSSGETYYDVVFKAGDTILQTNRVVAHTNVSYTGDTPSITGKVWIGWDKTFSDIIADTIVNATFVTPSEPEEPAVLENFDYAWVDDKTTYTSAYTDAEFAWILTQCATANISTYLPKGALIRFAITTFSGMTTDHMVMECIGYKHYELSDGSGWNKIVWCSLGVMNENGTWNSSSTNVGGWATCRMRTWLNDTLFPKFPQFIKSLVQQVKVLSSIGGMSATISSSDNNLFLLSLGEIGLSSTTSPYKEEVAAGAEEVNFTKFSSNANRIKKFYDGTGSGTIWWTRSPRPSSSSYVMYVTASGSSYSDNATSGYGVAPCFTT